MPGALHPRQLYAYVCVVCTSVFTRARCQCDSLNIRSLNKISARIVDEASARYRATRSELDEREKANSKIKIGIAARKSRSLSCVTCPFSDMK